LGRFKHRFESTLLVVDKSLNLYKNVFRFVQNIA